MNFAESVRQKLVGAGALDVVDSMITAHTSKDVLVGVFDFVGNLARQGLQHNCWMFLFTVNSEDSKKLIMNSKFMSHLKKSYKDAEVKFGAEWALSNCTYSSDSSSH